MIASQRDMAIVRSYLYRVCMLVQTVCCDGGSKWSCPIPRVSVERASIVCSLICFALFFQGASQSMPWLAELVQSSEGSLDVLPVQCLCEFLLLEKTADSGKEEDGEGSSKELQDKKVVSEFFLFLFFIISF